LRKNNVRIKAILKNFDKPITILQTIGILFKENEYETHGYHDHEGTFKSALRWLKQEVATDKEDPFFLLVHDATVHNPYEETPQKYKHLFGQDEVDNGPETIWDYLQHLGPDNKVSAQEKERIIALYDQGVRYLDDLLQDFIQNIPKKIIDSSVIFFVADHGDEFGNHDGKFNHGQSLYEELIHVPFMVRVPHIKPCSIKSSVSLLDLAPTILSVFDIKPPKKYCGNILDSKREKNVTKLILAEGDVPPFKRHTDLFTIDKKYLDKKVFHPLHQLSVMRGDWKFIATTEKSELFNVTNDPMESKNLYTKNALFKKTDLNTIQKLVKYAKKRINTSESSSVFAEQQK
jgi:arylsulfatase A-like enzyme